MTRARWVEALGGALGLAAGLWLSSRVPAPREPDGTGAALPEAPCTPIAGATRPTPHPPRTASPRAPDEPLAPPEDTDAARRVEALVGVPIGWPDTVPATHRPEAVTAALAEAEATCEAIAGLRHHLTCDEYPCILWEEVGAGAALDTCPSWTYRDVTSQVRSGTGREHAIAVSVLRHPDDRVDEDNLRLRLRDRVDFEGDVVMEEWDAGDWGSPFGP